MKFKKKPIVIEAEQYKGVNSSEPLPEGVVPPVTGLKGAAIQIVASERPLGAYIKTLEGNMLVSSGDWIITGVAGEKYPCKPDIFEATYEAVE